MPTRRRATPQGRSDSRIAAQNLSRTAAISLPFAARRNRGVMCNLVPRMQGNEEGNQSINLRRIQLFPIGGHVPTTLDDLPNQFGPGHASTHIIERRSTLASGIAEAVAIAALLVLEHQRTADLKWRASTEIVERHRITAPG